MSAHGSVDVGCGADGRDPGACSAVATVDLVMDSPLMVESMDYGILLECTEGCTEGVAGHGACGWEPAEVRPIGETGCTKSFPVSHTFRADLSGGCVTLGVRLVVSAQARLDPVPSVTHVSSDDVTVCPEA